MHLSYKCNVTTIGRPQLPALILCRHFHQPKTFSICRTLADNSQMVGVTWKLMFSILGQKSSIMSERTILEQKRVISIQLNHMTMSVFRHDPFVACFSPWLVCDVKTGSWDCVEGGRFPEPATELWCACVTCDTRDSGHSERWRPLMPSLLFHRSLQRKRYIYLLQS